MMNAAGARDHGGVATEYAPVAVLIAVVILAVVTQLAARVAAMFAAASLG